MSAICDAYEKKVDVERLYNPGEDRKSAVGDQMSWSEDAGMRTCPREAGPLAPG